MKTEITIPLLLILISYCSSTQSQSKSSSSLKLKLHKTVQPSSSSYNATISNQNQELDKYYKILGPCNGNQCSMPNAYCLNVNVCQ